MHVQKKYKKANMVITSFKGKSWVLKQNYRCNKKPQKWLQKLENKYGGNLISSIDMEC